MDQQKFVCDLCSPQREFGTIQALTAHARIHKGQQVRRPDPTKIVEHAQAQLDAMGINAKVEDFIQGDPEDYDIQVGLDTEFDGDFDFAEADSYGPVVVKVMRLPHAYGMPELQYATPGSAAVDIYAAIDKPKWISAQDIAILETGLCVEIPEGYVGKVVPRSGLAFNHGITLVNSPGIIDSDYRGEIKVALVNHSHSRKEIKPGDRIAQMLIEPVTRVDYHYVGELSETSRGKGGFGSTGR